MVGVTQGWKFLRTCSKNQDNDWIPEFLDVGVGRLQAQLDPGDWPRLFKPHLSLSAVFPCTASFSGRPSLQVNGGAQTSSGHRATSFSIHFWTSHWTEMVAWALCPPWAGRCLRGWAVLTGCLGPGPPATFTSVRGQWTGERVIFRGDAGMKDGHTHAWPRQGDPRLRPRRGA